MTVVLIFYGSIAFFFIACMVRFGMFLRAPKHVKWEIYKETPTYDPSMHTNMPQSGILKLRRTIGDIFFFRAYYQNKSLLWLPLFVFHLGGYLLFLWHVWLFATAFKGVSPAPTAFLWLGHSAVALAFIGGVGIVAERIFKKELRAYYSGYHYLKWLLILTLLVQGFLVVYFHFGNDMVAVTSYVSTQLSFDWAYKLHAPGITALHVILVAAWLIYMPFSHLMRLVLRYYHDLREGFSNPRSLVSKRTMSKNLNRPISWSASHIGSGKTWAGVVANNPGGREEERKD